MARIKLKKNSPKPDKKPFEGIKNRNMKFYNSKSWKTLRIIKLQHNPLCEHCLEKGLTEPAIFIDHIIPINKGGDRLSLNNLQSLCTTCNARKTAKDGNRYH